MKAGKLLSLRKTLAVGIKVGTFLQREKRFVTHPPEDKKKKTFVFAPTHSTTESKRSTLSPTAAKKINHRGSRTGGGELQGPGSLGGEKPNQKQRRVSGVYKRVGGVLFWA